MNMELYDRPYSNINKAPREDERINRNFQLSSIKKYDLLFLSKVKLDPDEKLSREHLLKLAQSNMNALVIVEVEKKESENLDKPIRCYIASNKTAVLSRLNRVFVYFVASLANNFQIVSALCAFKDSSYLEKLLNPKLALI